jgi:hypothetical protein
MPPKQLKSDAEVTNGYMNHARPNASFYWLTVKGHKDKSGVFHEQIACCLRTLRTIIYYDVESFLIFFS